jgi:hypothetical protein
VGPRVAVKRALILNLCMSLPYERGRKLNRGRLFFILFMSSCVSKRLADPRSMLAKRASAGKAQVKRLSKKTSVAATEVASRIVPGSGGGGVTDPSRPEPVNKWASCKSKVCVEWGPKGQDLKDFSGATLGKMGCQKGRRRHLSVHPPLFPCTPFSFPTASLFWSPPKNKLHQDFPQSLCVPPPFPDLSLTLSGP